MEEEQAGPNRGAVWMEGLGMTEQEREGLIEKMARHIAVSDDRMPDPNSEWCDENWHCYIPEARAALAVAEPVIREECARIIEPSFPRPCDCEDCYCGNRDDAERVSAWDEAAANAKAIREGGRMSGQDILDTLKCGRPEYNEETRNYETIITKNERLAIKEITRLREENARLRADLADQRLVARDNLDWFSSLKTEYDALRAENARLLEALKPFVPKTQVIEADIPDTRPIDVMVRAGELRAAAAAIREGATDE